MKIEWFTEILKTYEKIACGRTLIPISGCIISSKRKNDLRYLKFHLRKYQKIKIYTLKKCWKKARERVYILRVRKYYGYTTKQ